MQRAILLALILILSCGPERSELTSTKWLFQVTESCFDILEFKQNDSVSYFSCEISEFHFGQFKILKDTIVCEFSSGQFDKEFQEDSRHRLKPYTVKFVVNRNSSGRIISLNDSKNDSYTFKRK